MAQNYDDNAPAWGNQTDSDVAKIKNNFEALKSTFSGASQPPNPVAGMWWYDTTAHILKVRNEANNAWQSVWDLANNKPVIANLSNEITLDMMAASAKSPAAGTEGLRKLGTGATDACAGNDPRLFEPPDGSVSMAKMKAPTAGGTHIIARWQEAVTAYMGTPATLYVTVSGSIRVYCQLSGDGAITIFKNGSHVKTFTGFGYPSSYTDFTYDMAVTLGDRLDFHFSGDQGIYSKVRYGRIYSGTSIGAVS